MQVVLECLQLDDAELSEGRHCYCYRVYCCCYCFIHVRFPLHHKQALQKIRQLLLILHKLSHATRWMDCLRDALESCDALTTNSY